MDLSLRELRVNDIQLIADYWLKSDKDFLIAMGVDLAKLPGREEFSQMLKNQIELPLREKRSFCLIWLLDMVPVGHCNTNPSCFGIDAYMHMHLWQGEERKKGLGTAFVKMSLPVFFEKLELKILYSEPYSLNPAPNITLEKVGFKFIKEYTTTPGSLNFEQKVKRWAMSREEWIVEVGI